MTPRHAPWTLTSGILSVRIAGPFLVSNYRPPSRTVRRRSCARRSLDQGVVVRWQAEPAQGV